LELVFLLLSVFLPILLLGMLLVLWTAPLTAQSQERLLRISYFIESWTTIDVTVIVLGIACLEFGRLSEFLVYKSDFAQACTMFRDLTHTECMEVNLEAHAPLGVLAVAGVLNLVVPKVVIRLCASATAERLQSPVLALPKHDMERLSTRARSMESLSLPPTKSIASLQGKSTASLPAEVEV